MPRTARHPEIGRPRRPVDMLANSAGFGLTHSFELNDVADEVRHLHLHVEVPLRLIRVAVPAQT